MKKLLVLVSVLLVVFGLTACAKSEPTPEEPTGYEIALVTDVGTIDDKSFNQGAWEGVKAYAEENGVSYQYYKPAEQTKVAYLAAITEAVDAGAKIVVTPGYLFAPAVYEAQDLYPEVSFILLDADPHTEGDNPTYRIEKNVYAVYYAEEQSGFLAGYAAVKDGNTKLGFMGGMAVPAVVRFGYGFLQGADLAAQELGVQLEVNYKYLGTFGPDNTIKIEAMSWYSEGTQVIFAAAGGAGLSVMAGAEDVNAKVIGVDVDQSNLSKSVITSAMKGLTSSVYDGLTAYYAGSFKGGEIVTLDASVNGVGLPADFSRFTNPQATQADYDAIFAKLVDGSVKVLNDIALTPADLGLKNTTVNVIK